MMKETKPDKLYAINTMKDIIRNKLCHTAMKKSPGINYMKRNTTNETVWKKWWDICSIETSNESNHTLVKLDLPRLTQCLVNILN